MCVCVCAVRVRVCVCVCVCVCVRAVRVGPEPYRDRVATTEVQNAWSSRDSRRLQIVPGSALAGNSNCKNRVTELRFLVISRQ